MKAKDLIQKWKQEGVSDEIIRKRLIVLSQQAKDRELQSLDDTQDNVLEDQLTQTQIEVPSVHVSKKSMNLPPHFKSLHKLIIFALAINLVTLIYLIWSSGVQNNIISDLKQQVEALESQVEKPAKSTKN